MYLLLISRLLSWRFINALLESFPGFTEKRLGSGLLRLSPKVITYALPECTDASSCISLNMLTSLSRALSTVSLSRNKAQSNLWSYCIWRLCPVVVTCQTFILRLFFKNSCLRDEASGSNPAGTESATVCFKWTGLLSSWNPLMYPETTDLDISSTSATGRVCINSSDFFSFEVIGIP